MASEHELGIKFTSEGSAEVQKKIEGIADQVDDLNKGEVEIDVTADTREAETRIERFEREVDGLTSDARELRVEFRSQQINKEIKKSLRELEKLEDPVDIEVATADLERAQKDLRDLEELAGRKYEIEIDADPKRTAKRAAGDMEGLNETSQRGIGVLRGVTDELGETAQAGGVFGAAFVDAGEAVEIFGAKAGLSPEVLGKVAGALGGLGLAVTAGSVAWGLFNKAQKEADGRTKSLLGVQEELADQKYAEAAEKLADTYGDAFATAEENGISYARTLDFITNESSDLGRALAVMYANAATSDQEAEMLSLIIALDEAKTGFREQGEELKANNALVGELQTGLESAFGDDGSISSIDDATGAFKDLGDAFDDVGDAADDATSEIDELSKEVDSLVDELEGNVNKLKFDKKIDQLFQNVVESAKKADADIAEKGFDGAEESIRDAEIALGELRAEVGKYVSELEEIDPEIKTEIIAELDDASADEVLRLYEQLRAGVIVPVTIKYPNSLGYLRDGFGPRMAPEDGNTRGMTLDSPATATSPLRTRPVAIGPRTVQNITVNVPNGLNLRNVSDTLSRWQRVNGGRL